MYFWLYPTQQDAGFGAFSFAKLGDVSCAQLVQIRAQMQIKSCGSRLLSGHLSKAAQHIAGIVSPHVFRQSNHLTSGSSFSVSTLSAACQLARCCRQAELCPVKFDVQQLRLVARSGQKQAQSSQGRGFAAQTSTNSGAAHTAEKLRCSKLRHNA